jgi:soluble lytic murein transglycosylase-like protein
MAKRPTSEFLVAACALCGLGLPAGAAWADVLEIGPRGAVWKTDQNQPLASREGQSDDSQPAPDTELASATLTWVDTPVGPSDWRQHIADLATKYDVSPSLLEALIWQESRWNIRAKSSAGALGLAQLMPGTARELGVNSANPLSNLEGGARYLRMQLDRFGGDVEKALAAYNAGPRRVERANGMPKIRETRDYVASIMTRLSHLVRRY